MHRTPHVVTAALLTALALPVAAGCERTAQAGGDPAVFKAATAALDKRLAAVRDYTFEGTARQVETGAAVRLQYAFMQPQYAKGTLVPAAAAPEAAPGSVGQSVVFDGETLLALDHDGKTFGKLDKSAGDEQLLLALHASFSEFACEGWRPPLLKAKGATATAVDGTWVLAMTIDDAELAREELVLRQKDGAFLEKRTIDKAGKVVATTKIIEELDDPATGLKFPKKWQRTGPAGTFEVALDKATVNGGIRYEAFSTTVPEGYKPAS